MNAPAILVLLTQAVAVAWFCLLGSWAGALARRRVGAVAAVRVALWLGLAVATLTILLVHLVWPLRGGAALVVGGAITVAALGAWLLVRLRRAPVTADGPAFVRAWWVAVPVVALALLAFVVAHLAFGPVTNYDTGLYHLNAIQYAQDYPTIHGLANLHTRLGTNVSAFDVAAFLANTPWGDDAFRLVVGLFLLVVSVDVALRVVDGRTGAWRRPGTYLLLVALAVAVPGAMAAADYRVTSPSPDTVALALTLAAGAYLLDALVTREAAWAGVSITVAALAASVRTQLWVMFGATVVVLLVAWLLDRRRQTWSGSRSVVVTGGVLAGLMLVVMMVRDTLLSGWLLFPATYLPMPVSWRVPQEAATSTRDWILSWARDASASPDQTLTSWYWFGSWLRQSVTEWSVAATVGLLGLALLVWLAARGRRSTSTDSGWRVLLLALAPAVLTVLVWFWTAPDPRFAWGAILLVGAIPAALALTRLADDADASGPVPTLAGGLLALAVVPLAVGGLITITGAPGDSYGFRTYSFGPLPVVASVASLPVPQTTSFALADGHAVLNPVDTDQCWATFPACTPYQDQTLRFLGDTVADGFATGS